MSNDTLLQQLIERNLASQIFDRDTSAFANADNPDVRAVISNRLGWLRAPVEMVSELPTIDAFASAAAGGGLTDVYLLGMGGSSLCAEVLRDVPLTRSRAVRLVVLDTTDERTIRGITDALSPNRSLFIVASKSGSTIEVTSLERYFWSVITAAVSSDAGRHFIAITDPGTSLATHAATAGYRHTFINPPDIGGRYSALSLFGLVPAALLGVDVRALLASGRQMAERCRVNDRANPGLALGAFMGGNAVDGRDKLTLLVPSSLAPLGVWIEQLVAESTGKDGRGVLPIVGEPMGEPSDYGDDRAFVAILTQDDVEVRTQADRLEAAGHPVYRIETSVAELGGEFFRWEFATAVAGVAMQVNPFDEPDVRRVKTRTVEQLDAWKKNGTFSYDRDVRRGTDYSKQEHRPERTADDHDRGVIQRRYYAVLDYLPPEPGRAEAIRRLRRTLRQPAGVVTTHGVGPRYLHSTGQYHKGGPNTGSFLLITAADNSATPIPGEQYTFSVLKQAQALGDFRALADKGRDVIHYHLEDPEANFSEALEKLALELRS